MSHKTTKHFFSSISRLFLLLAATLALVASTLALAGCQYVPGNPYFKNSDAEFDTMDNLLFAQQEVDERIAKELDNARNTFENPLVFENPYHLAPLTALVVFQTETETGIDLSVNGSAPVHFESSTKHAIPVYGLFDGFANEVILTNDAGESTTLTIETEAYTGGVISVEENKLGETDELFLVSPDYERTSIYDASGRLLWYLDTPDNEGAVVFLDNGHFLISDPYQGISGIRINYASFLEMDYLGKVYKQYIGEYGYHHEIERIKGESEFLLPGHDEDSPFMQAILYSVDANTMKVKSSIDFYEVLHNTAPEWTESLLDKYASFNFVINGADYDEASGDAIISARATGMLIRVNVESGQIKWIFADPANVPEELQEYLLVPTDDTRYPYGQHACQFMPDGTIAYHNNDVDFLAEDQSISAMKGHYSSNEILDIDEDTRTVRTLWTYDANKKVLSKMSGSLEFLEGGGKLISYGSALKEDAYSAGPDTNIMNTDYIEALMMELDENDEVLWRATFPSIIHKVYHCVLYNTDTGALPNYTVEDFQLLDGQDATAHLGEEVDVEAISADLLGAEKLEGGFYFAVNRALLDFELTPTDAADVLFVSEDQTGRMFNLKKADEPLPIVNSGRYGVRVGGLEEKQKVYVRINDVWFDTEMVIDFDSSTL